MEAGHDDTRQISGYNFFSALWHQKRTHIGGQAMYASKRSLFEIIKGSSQFIIPVFQRDYTWSDVQCAQLWNDIDRAAERPVGDGHFLGSIVYFATEDSAASFPRSMLIDGQQRLTSLTLLLTALRDHIKETEWQGDEDGPTESKINAYYLKNLHEQGARQRKLVLRRRDHTTLQALIDKNECPSNASERIIESYEYFREQLEGAHPAKVYRGMGELIAVEVTLDRHIDNPQVIFESLNSTGIDLSQSDLIRNFLLMSLSEEEQTKLYETYWCKIEDLFRSSEIVFDKFARDYLALLTHARKQEREGEIYYAFRRLLIDRKEGGYELEEELKDMLRFARYYAAFSLGRGVPEFLKVPLSRLRRLVDVPAILVMRLFDCFDRLSNLTEEEFLTAIDLVKTYVFRRAVCGYQTRGYWQELATLAYKIKDDEPLKCLKVGLARQRANYRFPEDEEFVRALEERDLYGIRICVHLLERLENHGSREPNDTSQYTIEHILPQNEKLRPEWQEMLGEDWRNIQKTWLHRLGNLTLTGYNTKYSDRPFNEKKSIAGGFEDSSIRLNKFVREQQQWTPQEIETRGKELASKALQIWPPLVVEETWIEAARQEEMRDLASRRDVNNVPMSTTARELFDNLRDEILEIDHEVLELAEAKSVSYHGPSFFAEVLPRKHNLTILLHLDFNEIDDPSGIAQDATQWKFFFHAIYEGGVLVTVSSKDEIGSAAALVKQAHVAACS